MPHTSTHRLTSGDADFKNIVISTRIPTASPVDSGSYHTVHHPPKSASPPSPRAKFAVTLPPDFTRTSSKLGYEIQINNQYPDPHPTGSIYGFMDAKTGSQKENEWNAMDIESRQDMIRVKLNGVVVAEHPGDPKRPKTGPIGLQLHDQFCVILSTHNQTLFERIARHLATIHSIVR